MIRLPTSLLGAAALLAVAVGVWASHGRDEPPQSTTIAQPAAPKPRLALLTSLPILFGERFSLSGGSPLMTALNEGYQVQAIGVADAASLDGSALLLMAHPRAQPAEALVDLDAWVRAGGRLLLLADPRLEWPSDRPLGDKLRPPPDFADTGLLDHWGLTLAGPTGDGPVSMDAEGMTILASSPGTLSARGRACAVVASGLIARCRIGNGEVTVIADADFLNVSGPAALDGPTDANLSLVTRELARLAR